MNEYTITFREIGIADIQRVGGKNSSLGEMFNHLASKGVSVPDGFATTTFAFEKFLSRNDLHSPLHELMHKLDKTDFSNLKEIGAEARRLMMAGEMPKDIERSIIKGYRNLCGENYFEVAVRSSATAEDLPEASFAGQHESYLNIKGERELLNAVNKCFASLYTDRAIK